MKAELEKYLWEEIERIGFGNPFPRDVIEKMIEDGKIQKAKQAWRTLEKWSDKGWYTWGSIMDLGWKRRRE